MDVTNNGATILENAAQILALCYHFMQHPLFYIAGKPITLWNVCISFLALWVFRSFLDILGIWGYGDSPEEAGVDYYDE